MEQELLNRFFKGRCSPEESERIILWLTDPANKETARDAMYRHWNNKEQLTDDVDWNKLLLATKQKIAIRTPSDTTAPDSTRSVRWWRIAAAWSALALVSAAVLFMLLQRPEGISNVLHQAMISTHEVQSSSGQIILKILPDGTKVWLNSESKLIYPPQFGDVRTVELEGEAYFDVVEDRMHPFIVKTGEIKIRVLGTAFNIKSYPDDPIIATTLVRGKVLVERDASQHKIEENLELKPNEQAIFTHGSETLTLSRVEAEKFTSWTNGKLVFENAPVHDVLKSLERWYGVTIHVKGNYGTTCALTAQIDKEPLGKTLELLRSITGVDYRIAGDEVFIDGTICGK